MTSLAIAQKRIPAMPDEDILKARRMDAALREMDQVQLPTSHVLHGGMYARTISLPAGVAMAGVLIRVPTMLIFNGFALVNTGPDGASVLQGYHVIAASANRKQVFLAYEDSTLTMVFATQAKTIEEAEDEFTAESHLLMSRSPEGVNEITITGE